MAITLPVHNEDSVRCSGHVPVATLVDRWTLTGISPCCPCACICDGRVDR